jgi:hypothetical protein
MKSDQDGDNRFPQLPLALDPEDRLELEMAVLDQDSADARELLSRHGIGGGEGSDPLALCTEWLKRLRETEQQKHHISYDKKGPTLDPS